MPANTLKAQVRHQPGVAIIDLSGEINSFGEAALNAAYTEAERQESGSVLLNFTHVDYINSTGIALIVGLLARARKTHRKLLVCGLSEHYIEIFQITRLVDFMNVFPDETSALTDDSAANANQQEASN
jgi:anti-sigma B factor antagonist